MNRSQEVTQVQSAPLHPDEDERIAALIAAKLLDTPAEEEFDRLVRLASILCDTPMALVSLVDRERQWFKAKVGLDAEETPRSVAFCAHAILDDGLFEVENALEDERFADNPLVTSPPDLRFYAGYPLLNPEGHPLGTLCVLDRKPRKLSPEQVEALEIIRQQVMELIAKRSLSDRADQIARGWDFFENVADLVQSVTPEGRFDYVNRAWLQTLGYTRAEVAGLSVFDVIAPSEHAHCEQLMAKVLGGEQVHDVRTQFLTQTGEVVHVQGSVNAKLVNGVPALTRGVFRDVTHTVQLEAERDRFFQLSLDLLCIASFEGRFTRLNPSWTQVLGWSEEELRATPFIEFVHPDDREATLAEFGQLLEGEVTITFENRYRCRDGSYRWFLWSAVPYTEDKRVYAAARDITQRKLDEERLRAVLNNAPHAVLSLTPEGRIVSANPAAERTFGLGRAMLVDQPVQSLLPTLDPSDLAEGRVFDIEGLRGDGDRFDAELAVGHVMAAGLQWVCSVQDISHHKEVDRIKDQFVSTVSHELRTPLTSIHGALGLLDGGVMGELPEDAADVVRIARTNSDRLIRLINDILDVEKMRAGQLTLDLRGVPPSELVEATLEGLEGMAGQRGVKLVADLTPCPSVEADEDRLVQVLTNLVSNAIKFTPDGGSVTVRARPVPRAVRFEVADQGPGIAAADQERLFARFQQLDGSTTRHKDGSGLGLAIAKSLVEQHDGRIGLESEVGQGSTFWVEIPLAKPGSDRLLRGMVRKGASVLIVEDEDDIATILTTLLRQEGYHPTRVASVAAAREALERGQFKVVLLDIHLPDGNGLDLLNELSTNHDHHTPVIVLTGSTRRPEGYVTPMLMDWITKPFDERHLLQAVRQSIRRHGPARVLIVEDDASVRSIVHAQLAQLGVECLEAADGAEAIKLVRAARPDLLILDLGIPKLDGFEVVEILRQETRAASIPLLVYSGRDLTPADREALQLGVSRYLTKTRTDEGEFLSTVRELLNGLVDVEAGSG